MSHALPIELGWATDPGRVHPVNEDSYALFPGRDGAVLLVCDGMGGMGRGDEASQLAVRAIYQYLLGSELAPRPALAEALRRADYAIRRRLCSSGRIRPGATAASVYVLGRTAEVCWIGDSPTYHLRGEAVIARTRDDKLVEDLVDQGELSRQEAATSPLASVLTKALGGRPPSAEEVAPSHPREAWQLETGDCIVVCSDGLADLVTGPEIAEITSSRGPREAANELVRLANARGGHDNITVIVCRWGGETTLDEPVSNTDITPWMEAVDEHATDPHGLALERHTLPPDTKVPPAPTDNATVELPPVRKPDGEPVVEGTDEGATLVAALTVATLLAAAVAAASFA